MREALVLATAYGLGAIPFAWLAARAAGGTDIRREGSGNVGVTNVLRSAGVLRALVALALDAGKGAVAVWIARRAAIDEPFVALAGVFAVVGHILPPWYSFRGKGVATASGVFALLAPRLCLVVALVFLIVVWSTRYVSLGALVAALTLAVLAVATQPPPVAAAAAGVATLIVLRHRGNIERLRAGTEWRFRSREQ